MIDEDPPPIKNKFIDVLFMGIGFFESEFHHSNEINSLKTLKNLFRLMISDIWINSIISKQTKIILFSQKFIKKFTEISMKIFLQ